MARPEAVSDLHPPKSLRIDGTLPPRPRVAVLRTRYRVGMILGAAAWVAVAAVVVVVATFEAQRLARLRDHGVVTDAVVERKWKSGSKSKTRHASYTYTVDGQSWTDQSSVSSSRYDVIAPGQKIQITYDPADPGDTEIGAVTQETIDDHWLKVTLTSSIVGAIFLGFLIYLYLHHRGRKMLLTEGDLVTAQIESVGKASRKGKVCKVAFAVPTDGSTTTSRRHCVPQRLVDGLAAGDPIAYVVLRHEPKRGAPLALCLQSCRFE